MFELCREVRPCINGELNENDLETAFEYPSRIKGVQNHGPKHLAHTI